MDLKEGLVIKAIHYQDNAKIVYLITKEGKVSIIVKGATSMKSPAFQYAQELTLLGYDTKGKYLSTGKVLSSYAQIKQDVNKLESSMMILEITHDLIDHINDAPLFYGFLLDVLKNINEGKNPSLMELIFRVKILYLLGVAPVFYECVECGTRENLVAFSLYDGGMKCRLHHNQTVDSTSGQTLAFLREIYRTKFQNLTEMLDSFAYSYDEVDLFLSRYYEHYLGFKSRVHRVFSKINHS